MHPELEELTRTENYNNHFSYEALVSLSENFFDKGLEMSVDTPSRSPVIKRPAIGQYHVPDFIWEMASIFSGQHLDV
jgi:hypothetical protein